MPTPTNSVLTRDVSEEARISQLIYENESLKIEVETLKEQLESTGALRIEDLRKANEQLKIANTQLKVQLEEKTSQLHLLQNSDTRFSNIDDSLKQLLHQIQAQRDELTELRLVGKEKDDQIIAYKVRLEKAEAELADARQQGEIALQGAKNELARAHEEKLALTVELDSVKTATEQSAAARGQQQEALARQLAQKEERVRQCEAELLALKEAAAAQSAVRGDRATANEKMVADLQQREAASQAKVVALEEELAAVRQALAEAREQAAAMQREHQQQLAQAVEAGRRERERLVAQTAAAATTTGQRVDVYSPEVKAYVERKVREAVADRDRRLQEQVDQNANLLSRMALIQHESEQMVKKAGLSGRELTAMNDRVDAVSKARGTRNNMERRVADFLSSETFSKEDVQMLLQEMLDYQERTEEDISTRLLIKDMQAEEAEKTFRWNLKRLENENASLLKQLQKAAYASLQRHTRAEAESHSGSAVTASPAGATTATSTAGGITTTTTTPNVTAPAPAASMPLPSHSQAYPGGGGGFNSGRPNVAPNEDITPTRSAAPHMYPYPQQQYPANPQWQPAPHGANQTPPRPPQPEPRVRFQDPIAAPMGQFHPPASANPYNAQGAADPTGQQIPLRPLEPSSSLFHAFPGAAAQQDPNRHVLVPCPACTFEQRYGNVKCELCDTPLVLPRSM